MSLEKIISKKLKDSGVDPYGFLDGLYVSLDKENIKRTKNIRLIPEVNHRRGGKKSYAEWAHVIGIFQTLIFLHLSKKEGNRILDVGSGTGLLGIASEPFLGCDGKYIGIDVMKKNIDFCRSHYSSDSFEFIHFDVNNPVYTPEQKDIKSKWPVESESFDLITALSVWTHFNEDDALFYFKEASRVLKQNGIAIITFFLLDEVYENGVSGRSSKKGKFHMTSQLQWVFDMPAYGSDEWYYPSRAKIPESAIGITREGLKRLLDNSDLKLIEHHQGNWKEVPGMFFQDVLVFQKI